MPNKVKALVDAGQYLTIPSCPYRPNQNRNPLLVFSMSYKCSVTSKTNRTFATMGVYAASACLQEQDPTAQKINLAGSRLRRTYLRLS
jgi:hypothetical protein